MHCARQGAPECRSREHGRKPLSQAVLFGYKRSPASAISGPPHDRQPRPHEAHATRRRRRPGARRRPFHGRPAPAQHRPMPPSCARRTHTRACCRSTPTRRAKPRACWRCSPPQDIKAAGIGSISRHPPVVGRGGAKMVDAVPPGAGGDGHACRRPGRDGGGGEPCRRAGRRRPRAGRIRGTDAGGRSRRGDESRNAIVSRTRPAISASTGRGTVPSEDNEREVAQIIKERAARGARARRQPAHGGGLARDARRHRRNTTRQARATRCTPARRAPTACAPGGLHHGRAE